MAAAPAADGATCELRDGSQVRIRQIRPEDREEMLRGFERLSFESRYRRFLSPVDELTPAMLTYLTEVDHHHHEALVAFDSVTGAGVGVARFVRDPERPEVAEAAVTVVDDWQGRGLGTLLLEALSERGREEGVRTFSATMLGTNREMLEVLEFLGPVRVVDRSSGVVEVETELTPHGLAPALRQMLREAAAGPSFQPPGRVPATGRPAADRSGRPAADHTGRPAADHTSW